MKDIEMASFIHFLSYIFCPVAEATIKAYEVTQTLSATLKIIGLLKMLPERYSKR